MHCETEGGHKIKDTDVTAWAEARVGNNIAKTAHVLSRMPDNVHDQHLQIAMLMIAFAL